MCSNYSGIILLSLPWKVYSRVLEKKIKTIVDPQIQEEKCSFCPGHGTLEQPYTLHRVFEDSWEFTQPVPMCFVDLDYAFDCPLWCPVRVASGVWGLGPSVKRSLIPI